MVPVLVDERNPARWRLLPMQPNSRPTLPPPSACPRRSAWPVRGCGRDPVPAWHPGYRAGNPWWSSMRSARSSWRTQPCSRWPGGAKEWTCWDGVPGEALGCVQSWVMPAGCGTSEFLREVRGRQCHPGGPEGPRHDRRVSHHGRPRGCLRVSRHGHAPARGRPRLHLLVPGRSAGEVRRRILERLFQ